MNKHFQIIFLIAIIFSSLFSCNTKKTVTKADFIIGKGQIPNIAMDDSGTIQLVFGSGDSIMYASSSDKGISFSSPSVVAVLPGLYSSAMRGPQIAATDNGLVITACTSGGNIFSYNKINGKWNVGARVNDEDSVSKEGLMSLAGDGEKVYAIWLDLRGNKRNKIYGANSVDGGLTWSENKMIYTSPDTAICPCCKPSVVLKNNQVYVMFRNWLDGNRDLYLIQSSDGGNTFGKAQKLGTGNWKLNACPMDGGGLSVNKNGKVQTVWRRKGNIFTAVPGVPEIEIGEGRNCTTSTFNNENFYAWSDNNQIIITKAKGKKKIAGQGILPVLRALDENHVICVWQDKGQIHGAVAEL